MPKPTKEPGTDGAPDPTTAPTPPAPARVRYLPPPGTHTPVFAAGRHWHAQSAYALPAEEAAALAKEPGFAIIGEVSMTPAPKSP